MFDDMLKIFLFGFIELGTASLLTLTTPHQNSDFSFINMSVAVLVFIQLIITLPLTYSLILGQKQEVYQQKRFQERWSTFLFGIKILDEHSWQKQLYVISFLFTRYLFLTLAFVNNEGVFDVMLMMSMFFFNCAMFFSKAPLYGKWNNFLGRFNQFTMLVCTYHLIVFTDVVSKRAQYYGGWSLITVIVIFIAVNLLFFVLDILGIVNKLLL